MLVKGHVLPVAKTCFLFSQMSRMGSITAPNSMLLPYYCEPLSSILAPVSFSRALVVEAHRNTSDALKAMPGLTPSHARP